MTSHSRFRFRRSRCWCPKRPGEVCAWSGEPAARSKGEPGEAPGSPLLRAAGSPELLCVAAILEVPAQLPDRLVLFVANPLGRHAHLLGDVLHRPALEAPLQDALLPRAEQLGGGVAHGGPL